MTEIKYKISHREGSQSWTLSKWVSGRGLFARWRGGWQHVEVFANEADAIALMRASATKRVTIKFYDVHGDEDVGDGW